MHPIFPLLATSANMLRSVSDCLTFSPHIRHIQKPYIFPPHTPYTKTLRLSPGTCYENFQPDGRRPKSTVSVIIAHASAVRSGARTFCKQAKIREGIRSQATTCATLVWPPNFSSKGLDPPLGRLAKISTCRVRRAPQRKRHAKRLQVSTCSTTKRV